MSSIRLHKTDGANPRLTICQQCGEDVGLALIGALDWKSKCQKCGLIHYGGYPKDHRCPVQGCGGSMFRDGKIEEHEKLPGGICDKCEKLNKQTKQMVEEGGIYFKRADCGSAGAIRVGHPLSKAVRKKHGLEAPAPCGVEFTKDDCPSCSDTAVALGTTEV